MGYDDSEFARYLGLTSLRVPLREIGRRATEVVLTALADPRAEPKPTFLSTELVVRQTCGSPPAQLTV